jgi:hypothetical protein
LPANFKAQSGERELPNSPTEKLNSSASEDQTSTAPESQQMDEQNRKTEKTTKRKTRKPQSRRIQSEKRTLCEFEEESATGEKAKHKYTCSFSDAYDIKNLIQKKNFSAFRKFQLNLEAMQIKQTGKIDKLLSLDAIRTKLVPDNFQMQTALQVINEMNGNAILADRGRSHNERVTSKGRNQFNPNCFSQKLIVAVED